MEEQTFVTVCPVLCYHLNNFCRSKCIFYRKAYLNIQITWWTFECPSLSRTSMILTALVHCMLVGGCAESLSRAISFLARHKSLVRAMYTGGRYCSSLRLPNNHVSGSIVSLIQPIYYYYYNNSIPISHMLGTSPEHVNKITRVGLTFRANWRLSPPPFMQVYWCAIHKMQNKQVWQFLCRGHWNQQAYFKNLIPLFTINRANIALQFFLAGQQIRGLYIREEMCINSRDNTLFFTIIDTKNRESSSLRVEYLLWHLTAWCNWIYR